MLVRKIKRLISLVVVVVMVATVLAGCGEAGGGAETGIEGKYISIVGEMLGMTLTDDKIAGWAIELSKGGKGRMEIDGEDANIKWTLEDTALTIKVQGEELSATVDGDLIIFDDIMDTGMKLTFAKEGSSAASDPMLTLSEEEKTVAGKWVSDSVKNALGDDASGEIAADAFTADLAADKSAVITYKGEDMGEQTWSIVSGMGSIDDLDINFEVNDDGSLDVTYFEGDDYYEFHCVKR